MHIMGKSNSNSTIMCDIYDSYAHERAVGTGLDHYLVLTLLPQRQWTNRHSIIACVLVVSSCGKLWIRDEGLSGLQS